MIISEYFNHKGKASVQQNEKTKEYFIVYFDKRGNIFNTEKFPGKSIYYVEDAAENWALGIKENIS